MSKSLWCQCALKADVLVAPPEVSQMPFHLKCILGWLGANDLIMEGDKAPIEH